MINEVIPNSTMIFSLSPCIISKNDMYAEMTMIEVINEVIKNNFPESTSNKVLADTFADFL